MPLPGFKRLPGRPRKDGLPPGTRNPTPETAQIARIRYLAGRGLPPEDIAMLAGVPVEDVMPRGALYDEVRMGKAEANLAVAEALFKKALDGKTIESLFWAKCNLKWSETAAGRAKAAAETTEEDEITGIEIEVIEPAAKPELAALPGGKKS